MRGFRSFLVCLHQKWYRKKFLRRSSRRYQGDRPGPVCHRRASQEGLRARVGWGFGTVLVSAQWAGQVGGHTIRQVSVAPPFLRMSFCGGTSRQLGGGLRYGILPMIVWIRSRARVGRLARLTKALPGRKFGDALLPVVGQQVPSGLPSCGTSG